MSEFFDNKKAKSRLLAYYKGLGKDSFPINLEYSINYINELDNILEFDKEEEPIVKFAPNKSIEILISTRVIYLIFNKHISKIPFKKLRSVFLNRNFKDLNTPKELNFLLLSDELYKIKFDDLYTLTSARNEIYRIVNTCLEDWEGSKFRADHLIFKGKEFNF